MSRALSPRNIAASLTELWSPRIVAEVDEAYVKVARVQGVLGWHSHANEDEMFMVLEGNLRIDLEDGTAADLGQGDIYVVPKGVRHNPSASEDCLLMLIERKTTLHTGDVVNEKTRSVEEQRRPLG